MKGLKKEKGDWGERGMCWGRWWGWGWGKNDEVKLVNVGIKYDVCYNIS